MQKTLVIIKPDAMERKLYPEIFARYRDKGLRLIRLELKQLTPKVAVELYAPHKDKVFFDQLIEFMTSGPVICCVYEGDHAVDVVRNLNGLTDSVDAYAGTIRGDYGTSKASNVVHGSDSITNARREIKIIFGRKRRVN